MRKGRKTSKPPIPVTGVVTPPAQIAPWEHEIVAAALELLRSDTPSRERADHDAA